MRLVLALAVLAAIMIATFVPAYRRSPQRLGLPPLPTWFLWTLGAALVGLAFALLMASS